MRASPSTTHPRGDTSEVNKHAVTAVSAVALLGVLTACGSADKGGSVKPSKEAATPSAKSSAPAQPSLAEQIKACTDAIAAGKDEGDGAPECTDLSPDDYFKALQAANKQVQDAFQKQTDEAASKAANGSN
ncbi:hypothetical protein ABT124_24860 [Streptomyces sp. NPDC001982]|uniref:hypothetical protein n=1 Tax=unclassified Streptomyces TaxID=2593676 RepID=UPI00332BEFD2